ncbi:MAG TPA: ribulose-phosphate 3-epimerase [Thermotogota bacterium]|jgi:ribulose-phosphate 3-epimerase|nr:ribulose-phosphate 3-epimerase [Thermotogota bacterium]NLZ12969.1 ribulose-phosphate 3-epimerase [Thermotogaceae bacterium]MDD8052586.1 ribulose-phosphate 3-epimerase [Thermotogota bacterium]HNR63169.1 ribulose-phosphate 3-epimerase [Thermotogota bacterium]HNT95416.1 ribulose-phosphate 3-epimerase [Thermotogota bacterium]
MKHRIRVSPSILAADFANLEKEIRRVEEVSDYLHIDVMDGHYVPNITIGIPVVEAIRRVTSLKLDVHLMISRPDDYIDTFIRAGANPLTVHYETCPHLHASIARIKSAGVEAFVSLNPHTPVSILEEILPYVDGVLIMSVNPGFGGQRFISGSFEKIRKLAQMREAGENWFLISVDGGVNDDNYEELCESGADILVAGSAIFGAEEPKAAILKWKKG